MNYGKKGVRTKQKGMTSKSKKMKNMVVVTIMKTCLISILSIGILGVCLGLGMFKGILASAPDISTDMVIPDGYTSIIYDNAGTEMAKLVASDGNRRYVTMDKIPEDLAHAFVAIEDERFYEHNGIDMKGIMRAAFVGIKSGGNFSEGASTITQQLVKNNVLTDWVHEETFGEKVKRKVQEQYCAIELSTLMSKDDVLEQYMNTINLGQNTLGVQAASLRYFNKPAYQLTLSECAVIAGITQNPTKFNPITRPDENAIRRDKVLDNMLEQGYISEFEYDEAIADDVYSRIQVVNETTGVSAVNSYFTDALIEDVYDDLINKLGYNETQAYTALYSSGLNIYSTQDSSIQKIADDVYSNEENYPEDTKWELNYQLTITKANGETENHSTEMFKAYYQLEKPSFNLLYNSTEEANKAVDAYKDAHILAGDKELAEKISLTPQPQVSFTIADQHTGQVVAMIGGRGPKEASLTLNRAANTPRPPGSCFKVLASFGPALDGGGLTLATVFNDAPFKYDDGKGKLVRNHWGGEYRGPIDIRTAIVKSANVVAVKTLTQITPQLGFSYLQNFGFTTLAENEVVGNQIFTDIGQPLALGGTTNGVTNLEMNAAYATIANNGTYIEPSLYTKITDQDGNVILDNTQPESHQVLKESTAFLLTDAMVDVVTHGTGGGTALKNIAVAGKTGTASDDYDAWWAAYTPYYTATSWVGYDHNVDMSSTEKRLAKGLWHSVMTQVHEDLPAKTFNTPSGIVTATICKKSGKLPIAGLCDTLATEYFEDGTVPVDSCNYHFSGLVCAYDMLPAQEVCYFKVPGVLNITPPEHESLIAGSGTPPPLVPPVDPVDPLVPPAPTTPMCRHDALFIQQPNYDATILQQEAELLQRNAAAAAEAAAAAAPIPVAPVPVAPVPTPVPVP